MLQSLLKTTSCRASFLTLLLALFSFGLSAQIDIVAATPAGTAVDIDDNTFDEANPDLADMVTVSVDIAGIPAGATISDISTSMKINHTWVGDLVIIVETPNGDLLPMMYKPGTDTGAGYSDDLVETSPISFADGAAVDAEDMGLSASGTVCEDDGVCDFFPNGDGLALPAGATGALMATFADLEGQSDGLNGTWTLHVGDSGGGDTGNISGLVESFVVSLTATEAGGGGGGPFENCGTSPAGMAVDIPENTYDAANPTLATMASVSVDVDVPAGATIDDITVMTKLNHTWVGDVIILLEAPNGDILHLIHEPGNDTPGTCCGDSSDFSEDGPLNFSDAFANDPEDMGSTIDGGQFVCVDDAICDYFPNPDGALLPTDATGALVNSFADFFAQGDGLDGSWTLHVADGNGGDTGDISGEMMAFEICISGEAGGGCVADFECEETINVSLDVDAEATITVEDLLQDGFEFCDGDIVTITQSSFGCSDIGEVVVTVVVNDDFDASNDDDADADTDEQRCSVVVVVDGDDVPDANLACLGRINLTLNDECQGLLIPEMVLTGDRQCLDLSGLEVIVNDSDPSNGPIIDGCGEFTYTVRVIPENVPTVGFTGDFAPENWTLESIFYLDGGVPVWSFW